MKIDNLKIRIDGKRLKIAIVLPYFNESMGLELLQNTKEELLANQVKDKNIKLFRVAGALEIPLACQKIIAKEKPNAIVALGIVVRGKTTHYDLVVKNSYQGIMEVQLKTGTPIAFGILACENLKQAHERISKKGLNKGKDAAKAALIQTLL